MAKDAFFCINISTKYIDYSTPICIDKIILVTLRPICSI